jgi:hypothetical protein
VVWLVSRVRFGSGWESITLSTDARGSIIQLAKSQQLPTLSRLAALPVSELQVRGALEGSSRTRFLTASSRTVQLGFEMDSADLD